MTTPVAEDFDARYEDATEAEKAALRATEVVLSETSQEFVNQIIDKLMGTCDVIAGRPFYPYQVSFARRIFESLIIGDGATITALFSRQSGKTETVAVVIAVAMIMFPRLARIYPELFKKFERGLWVGAFGPTDMQADIIHGRIVSVLTSDRAVVFMSEMGERPKGKGRKIWLSSCKSMVFKNTCHPRAKIEGQTFHVLLVDECQDAEAKPVQKSVEPMGASTNATKIYTGTPTYKKGIFYNRIQQNKREAVRKRARTNHFEIPWRIAAKSNQNYYRYVMKAMLELGENSDEFRLSYELHWLIDKGMFTTTERFGELMDRSMPNVVPVWLQTPVVVGIDVGRIKDRTVVTVVFVDWNNPDAAGYVHHRVLNWLDLENTDWEEQYFRIRDFLSNYKIYAVGVNQTGIGDVVLQRLKLLMPHIHFEPMLDGPSDQSGRWKYLKQLMDRHQIAWPGGAKVQGRRTWRRFKQEMEDLQVEFKGANMKCEAPNENDAHDDYPDSLAMACYLTARSLESQEDEMTTWDNPFFGRTR